MKKTQMTLRVLPIVAIALEREIEKLGNTNLNSHINLILEKHITKQNQDEKITESLSKKIEDLEEKLEKTLKQTTIELEWNKRLLAKVCSNFNVSTERN